MSYARVSLQLLCCKYFILPLPSVSDRSATPRRAVYFRKLWYAETVGSVVCPEKLVNFDSVKRSEFTVAHSGSALQDSAHRSLAGVCVCFTCSAVMLSHMSPEYKTDMTAFIIIYRYRSCSVLFRGPVFQPHGFKVLPEQINFSSKMRICAYLSVILRPLLDLVGAHSTGFAACWLAGNHSGIFRKVQFGAQIPFSTQVRAVEWSHIQRGMRL